MHIKTYNHRGKHKSRAAQAMAVPSCDHGSEHGSPFAEGGVLCQVSYEARLACGTVAPNMDRPFPAFVSYAFHPSAQNAFPRAILLRRSPENGFIDLVGERTGLMIVTATDPCDVLN